MSFIGRLFGTEKALDGVISGVTKGLDALVYTDEEKAQEAAQDRSEARKMIVGWMSATQGQNLARRFISLSVTMVWLTQYILAQIFSIAALFVDDPSKIQASVVIIREGANGMSGAVMLILGFYFAAPHMSGIAEQALKRFGNSSK